MPKDFSRLSTIDSFEISIVKANIEEICEYYAGLHAAIDDDDPIFLLRADDARIEEQTFGCSRSLVGMEYEIETSPNAFRSGQLGRSRHIPKLRSYPFYGLVRISRISSAPEYLLIEGPLDSLALFSDSLILSLFLDQQVISFRSHVKNRGGGSFGLYEPSGEEGDGEEAFHHEMWVDGRNVKRRISAVLSDEGSRPKYEFSSTGEVLEFEDLSLYQNRLVRDRFNREIICSYLENLGIDPIEMLLERKLSDPVLLSYHTPEGSSSYQYERLELNDRVFRAYRRVKEIFDHPSKERANQN